MGWNILVLITKGTTDTRVIGLVETLWKVVGALIDTCMFARLQMHNALHGFSSVTGVRTAITELKITQELSRIDHDPLFLVFLYLRNTYSTMDYYRLLITLGRYGAGPRLCGLLEIF